MQLVKIIPVISVALLLGGCAGMNNDFDCNKVGGMGAGCVSMGQVNGMVNDGKINANSDLIDHPVTADGNDQMQQVKIQKALGYKRTVPTAGRPTRTVDIVSRIWLSPWKDKGDNYHDSSFIYTVITHSHWNDYPVSAIQNEEL